MKNPIALLVVLGLWSSMPALAAGTKVQCWTDEEGRRACGDVVPPRYADKERDIMNKQGVLIDTKPRAPTAEEVQAAEDARKRAAEEEREAQRKHAYDRYLLESFQSTRDLEATRDARLKALDTRIELATKAMNDSQAQLDSLVAHKQLLQRESKPIDKRLEGQIQEYRKANIENPKALENLRVQREKLMTQFDNDIARFRELRHETAAQP